jgi:hypothetical protein
VYALLGARHGSLRATAAATSRSTYYVSADSSSPGSRPRYMRNSHTTSRAVRVVVAPRQHAEAPCSSAPHRQPPGYVV